jgi:hypothetical protein
MMSPMISTFDPIMREALKAKFIIVAPLPCVQGRMRFFPALRCLHRKIRFPFFSLLPECSIENAEPSVLITFEMSSATGFSR